MYRNFAVTGMGRSGTKFLAEALNLAEGWTVAHEAHPGFQPTVDVRERFMQQRTQGNYGEVNSYLRFQALSLNVDQLMVVVRDPIEIFQSMYNRGKPRLAHLVDSLYVLDSLIQLHIPTISFSQMTSSRYYLQDVAEKLGVPLPSSVSLKPSNSSARSEMPETLFREVTTKTAWFSKQYRSLW